MSSKTVKEKVNDRKASMKAERESFFGHWQDLSDYIQPHRGRFFHTDRNKGRKRNNNIIDNTGVLALRTLSSGMMAGLTSPARPWFKLSTQDPDLIEFGPVKNWLNDVERLMREIFSVSNLYNVLPSSYDELGGFGTSAFLVLEDFEDVVRFYPFTIGEYTLATNDRGEVDTICREVPMTVGQVVQMFGKDAVSETVRKMWNDNKVDKWLKITHMIEPNDDRMPELKDAKNKAFRSVWFEEGDSNKEQLLRQSGFDEFPVMAPRWHVTGADIYGTRCPGMDALGDIKQLQVEQKKKGQGIEKLINPPMVGPSSMKNKRASVLPGDITYQDIIQGQRGFAPTYQINLPLGELKEDINEVQGRISRAFYEDMFLMLAQSDRREITAREIEERHEEKLLMLGPVLERLNDELLDPLIDRTFSIMMKAGIVPPPPEELQGTELRIQYISILAQAQQSVGIAGIDRLTGFVGSLAAVKPEVIDKIDFDQTVDEYGAMLGVSPKIIRSDDDVEAIRTGRAEQEQAAQQQEQLAQMVDSAKTLSETSTDTGSLLDDVSGALPGGI